MEFQPRVFEVVSSKDPNKKYFVTNYRPNRYSCTCKDFLYRSHNSEGYSTGHKCKHIVKILGGQ